MPFKKKYVLFSRLSRPVVGIVLWTCSWNAVSAESALQIEYLVIARVSDQGSVNRGHPTEAELLSATLLTNLPESANGHHRLVKNTGRLSGVRSRFGKSSNFRPLVHAELAATNEYRVARYAIGAKDSASHAEVWIAFRLSSGAAPRLDIAALYKQDVPGSASQGATSITFDERFRTAGILGQQRISAGGAYFFSHADFDVFISVGKSSS